MNAKLDLEKVKQIRALLKQGKSCYQIAQIFNVHVNTIKCVRANKTWNKQ